MPGADFAPGIFSTPLGNWLMKDRPPRERASRVKSGVSTTVVVVTWSDKMQLNYLKPQLQQFVKGHITDSTVCVEEHSFKSVKTL